MVKLNSAGTVELAPACDSLPLLERNIAIVWFKLKTRTIIVHRSVDDIFIVINISSVRRKDGKNYRRMALTIKQ